MDWAHDSAWRFMPLVRDPLGGLLLHPIDLAVNKVAGGLGQMKAQTGFYYGRRGGGFDPPAQVPWAATSASVIDCDAHRTLARQAAATTGVSCAPLQRPELTEGSSPTASRVSDHMARESGGACAPLRWLVEEETEKGKGVGGCPHRFRTARPPASPAPRGEADPERVWLLVRTRQIAETECGRTI